MMAKRLKVAVIGCGRIGSFHAEKYSRNSLVELVALCDLNKTKASSLAGKYNSTAITDYNDLLEMGVDCVSVASDTTSHFEISKKFLENSIDVLVEKPLCTSILEAETLVEISESNNRILQVGHLERFNPAIKKIKEHLANPWFFEIRRIAPFSGRGADVDVVLDLMIHDIDLLLYLVNKPIERVEALGIPVITNSIDVANARIYFEGGIVANISTSRAAFKSERSFRVFQPKNYLSLDLEAKKLKIVTKKDGNNLLGYPSVNQIEEKFDMMDSLEEEINSFLECVKSRSRPLVCGKDGLNAMIVVSKVKEAMKVSAEKFGELPVELRKAIGA